MTTQFEIAKQVQQLRSDSLLKLNQELDLWKNGQKHLTVSNQHHEFILENAIENIGDHDDPDKWVKLLIAKDLTVMDIAFYFSTFYSDNESEEIIIIDESIESNHQFQIIPSNYKPQSEKLAVKDVNKEIDWASYPALAIASILTEEDLSLAYNSFYPNNKIGADDWQDYLDDTKANAIAYRISQLPDPQQFAIDLLKDVNLHSMAEYLSQRNALVNYFKMVLSAKPKTMAPA